MHGDYVNTDVELKYRENTDTRGLFARKELKRGTLIFAEKAVISVFPRDPAISMPTYEYKQLRTPSPKDDPLLLQLIEEAFYAVFHRKLGWQLYNLHDPRRQKLEK